MDTAQVFIFDLGWLFFAAWGTILAAVSVIAFGPDILASATSATSEQMQIKSANHDGHEITQT